MNNIVDFIIDVFLKKGHELYGGEAVTQLEHGLQAAHFAKEANASENLIAAALMHDIGHLLHDLPDDATNNGIDDVHEALGAEFLIQYFKEEVVEAVKLHVPAKRYLCLVDPEYYEALSSVSKASLILQGGIMSMEEKNNFELNEYFKEAVALRRWDDQAKIPNLKVDDIYTYRSILEQSLFKNSL
jgi:phosphonate degradation associated HDIG domain protein